jgi:uncharacterized protein (DUF983 family)
MKSISRFQSILEEKCPRCRVGKMFGTSPYRIRTFDKMHENCPECGLKFDIEPGFYTGAMYVSYAFSVAIFLVTGFCLYLFFNDPDLIVYVLTTFSIVILLFPLLYRYSRVIYLHLFGGIRYDADYRK